MNKGTTRQDQAERFRQEIQVRIRLRIREAIEVVIQEELKWTRETKVQLSG